MIRSALASQKPHYKGLGLGVSDPAFLTADSVPASVGGWDTLSPLASMEPDHAVVLDNWIPRPGYLEVRKGSQSFSSISGGSTTSINTLMAYNAPNTTNSMFFAVAGTTIYNVTAGSTASATSVTTLGSSQCQYVNHSNNAGNHFLIMVNGTDTEQIYNGSTWSNLSVTGFTAGSAVNVATHKGRLWFAVNNSTTAYYLPVGAISGAATNFELGPFFPMGGYLQAIGTWTIDTKQTVDEYIAFISSRGEVVVYEGTDPSSSSTWSEVGTYRVGAPIGRRCFTKIAGNLFLICVDGLIPMTEMLSTDRAADNRVSPFAQIMDTVRSSAKLYQANFGWQFTSYPRGQLGILNVPTSQNSVSLQYVINTLTGAPCRFLGMNANTWEIFNDAAYFGGNDGNVYLFDTDSADGSTPITATVQTAFNYFGKRGIRKKFNSVRPLLTTDHTITPGLGINVDYDNSGIATTPSIGGVANALWDSAVWDTAIWPNPSSHVIQWQTVAGEGFAASIIMTATTTKTGNSQGSTLQLNAFDINMEPGGML